MKKTQINQKNISERKIEKAFLKSNGSITETAKILGISRTTFYTHVKKHPLLEEKLKELRDEIRFKRLEHAELQLAKKVEEGDMKAIIYTIELYRKGFNRQNDSTVIEIQQDDEDNQEDAIMAAIRAKHTPLVVIEGDYL
jgi:DNA invertase Pin-like site-specific DNA recombinase